MRSEKILLPGVSVLARLVAEVRTEMSERLYTRLAGRVSTEPGRRLDKLLTVASGSRVSELDRLRRAPTRASGLEMVRALDRVAEVASFGAARVDIADVPPGRVQALARVGLTGDAFTLRRLPVPRRSATLLATARTLCSNAIDDALDLFAVLMASKLIGPAERASAAERLRSLPQLAKASATLAIAARVLLELIVPSGSESDPILDPAAAWSRLQTVVDRDELAAIAVQGLADLLGRKRLRRSDIVEKVVFGSWRRFVVHGRSGAWWW